MGKTLPFRLTLASGSVGRRWLLEKAGYTFDILPANIDEPTEATQGSCRQYVQHVCWLKAAAVAPKVKEGIVLAADSVGWINDRVIGKPEDEADARRILMTLAGHVHELWTGVCLWRVADGFQICWQERTLVRMKSFTSVELDAYLATKRWVGCSGAYAIEEENDPYLTIENGSLSNVIGLPMESLERAFAIIETCNP
ncbi:MAG: Maf family protein [Planctomycetes bacterium]|nr:Maf family protein [Planctomycetota bacterium]